LPAAKFELKLVGDVGFACPEIMGRSLKGVLSSAEQLNLFRNLVALRDAHAAPAQP
jgi:hypothetical protein